MSHRIRNKTDGAEKKRESFWAGLLPVELMSALPAFYLFAQNAFICSIVEVLMMVVLSLGVGLAAYTVLYFLFGRHVSAASAAGIVCMVLFSYFGSLCAFTEQVTGSERSLFGFLLAAAIAAALLIPLYLLRKKNFLRYVRAALCVFLIAAFAMNAITAASGVIRRRSSRVEVAKQEAPLTEERKPNFYFFVMDEYAAFDLAEAFYGYDNSSFGEFLNKSGFDVSSTSSNASYLTIVNISNDLNLAPITPENVDWEEASKSYYADSKLFRILRENGYACYQASTTQFAGNVPSVVDAADYISPLTHEGKSLPRVLLENSMLRPFSWRITERQISFGQPSSETTPVSKVFDYWCSPQASTASGNVALFGYVLCPHIPYMFNADGTIVPSCDRLNFRDPQRYIEQYKYATRRATEMVQSILKNDPDCVIVLQSDHGITKRTDESIYPTGRMLTKEDSKHIFNAVYFRGEPIDIEGLSGPDTLRLVLEKMGAKID